MEERHDPVEAVKALRARGVDTADELLEVATTDQILAACRRWDARQGVGPGLLVRWIRAGQFDEPEPTPKVGKAAQLRARFNEATDRFPPGSIVETHEELLARRWPEDLDRTRELGQEICDGRIVVVAAMYPVLEMECDRCGFTAGVTPRSLHVLPVVPVGEEDAW